MKQRKFMSVGLMLVIIGGLWLLQEVGVISGSFWGFVLPVLLILFGLDLLSVDKTENRQWFNGFSFQQPSNNHKHEEKKRDVVDEQ
jgi:hypothetical protein